MRGNLEMDCHDSNKVGRIIQLFTPIGRMIIDQCLSQVHPIAIPCSLQLGLGQLATWTDMNPFAASLAVGTMVVDVFDRKNDGHR